MSLPVRYREAVVLCDLQELSYAEAADGARVRRWHRAIPAASRPGAARRQTARPRSDAGETSPQKVFRMTPQDLEPDIPERLRELAASEVEPAMGGDRAASARRLFAAHQARDAASAGESRNGLRLPRRMWRVGAAAAVVLAAAITFYPRPEPRPVPPPKPAEAPLAAPLWHLHRTQRATRPRGRKHHWRPAARIQGPAVPGLNLPGVGGAAARAADVRRLQSVSVFRGLRRTSGASALPDFESGRIMRIEIPLTGLPAYGLDMVLDATPGTIEADASRRTGRRGACHPSGVD